MASTSVTFSPLKAIAEHVVLHVQVKGLRLARLRLRCAVALCWLAAKVGGTGFSVSETD